MIGWLKGRLLRRRLPAILVDAGGVGYEVTVPLSTFETLPAEGGPVELEVLTCFRNESLELFGFRSEDDKQLFGTLLTVSGVGPKLALSMLSSISMAEMVRAVEEDRPVVLECVPGIGKKTAKRLVLELKDRLGALAGRAEAGTSSSGGPEAAAPLERDAILALENLGYRQRDAAQAVRRIVESEGEADLAGVLRRALRLLGS